MPILNSNRIIIRFADSDLDNRVTITHLTNVSLDINNNLTEVTRSDTNSWKELISGIKGSSLSFEAILDMDDHYDHIDEAIAGTEVTVLFGTTSSGWNGSGFISNISVSGGTDESPLINGSIEITGALTRFVNLQDDPLLDHTGDPILDNTGDDIIARIPV